MMPNLNIICPHQLEGTRSGIAEAAVENVTAATAKASLIFFIKPST